MANFIPQKQKVMERTYQQLKSALINMGYIWNEKQGQLNCIWERTNDEITNKFTDLLHITFMGPNNVGQILTIPATTKPGLKGSILEPTTVAGVTGTAIIKPGQYKDAWEFRDNDKEFSSYPYFKQVGQVDYWRDGNKDTHVDHVQDQDKKVFGTHWHRMSQNNTYGSGLINNWSLGCMGAAEPEFEKILPLVRIHVKTYGPKFTGTVIESINIKN